MVLFTNTHYKSLTSFCIQNTSLFGHSLLVRRSSADPGIILRSIRPGFATMRETPEPAVTAKTSLSPVAASQRPVVGPLTVA